MKKTKLYKIWNQVPVDYYQKGIKANIFQRTWHINKINTSKKIIANIKFKNCLDVGCASGYMISEIAKDFGKTIYFGVDAYDKAIKYGAKQYPNIKFKVAMAEKLPFKQNCFDLIICYETMEHVNDPRKALSEIKRVLAVNGSVILAMDSGNWMFRAVWEVWERTKGTVWKGAHLNPFHHEELEKLIKQVGLKIKKKFFSHFGMEVIFILSK